jgi:glycosyltransferase involved in cell wall biosynthesis
VKVVVAHHLWSRVGGGELVNAYVVKTLLEAGHDVIVVATFGFDKEKYKEWFGIDLTGVKAYTLLPRMLPLFGIYQRLGFFIPLRRAIKKEEPDVMFVDSELYKPIAKLKDEYGFSLIEYIHFPYHALLFEKDKAPKEYIEAFESYVADAMMYHKKYEKGLWRLYFKLWLELYKLVAREDPFAYADVVAVNSKYIARLVELLWGGTPVVIHPPVKVRDFEPYGGRGFEERDNAVVMIGRVSPEKRVETVIDAISLTDTKPELRVVGGLIPSTVPYKEKLKKRAREKGVRVEFYPNAPRRELVRVATTSKVFVHATIGEHFGIAVVEGMAAGCPAVVHKSGGPYLDIIDGGRYGLAYETPEELAEIIDKLITDPRAWRHYHELSLRRARFFSEEEFSKKILWVVEHA